MRALLVCLGLSVLLSSCAQVPKQVSYPYSGQQKMQSVQHWEKLATQVVEEQVSPKCPQCPPAPIGLIYVDDSDRTEFGKAFHNYLVTELMYRNVQISPTRQDATVLKWGTQLVFHSKPFVQWPGLLPGTFEVVANVLGGPAITSFNPPDTELIVTVQVGNSRRTYNYYINDCDKWNFYSAQDMADNKYLEQD